MSHVTPRAARRVVPGAVPHALPRVVFRAAPRSRRPAPPRRGPVAAGIVAGTALGCLAPFAALAADPVQPILSGIPVSRAQLYVQQTPIAVRDGTVYVATMEPGPGGDSSSAGDLRTVVRKGVPSTSGGSGEPGASGEWSWTATSIDDRTVADAWHTAPAIGLDEAGHVHVAYNMHNLPWQYVVSRSPGDIDAFDFRGQAVTQAELDRYRLRNRTSFPDLGTAAIPGNQITYPAFVNDRAGRLHVSYRFAAKPARSFEDRTLSTGIARYDVAFRTWRSLGGALAHAPGDHDGSVDADTAPRSVASAPGWTSYLPRPTFAPDGSMTVSLAWRSGGPGPTVTRPCALHSADGEHFASLSGAPVAVPALPDDCPGIDSASREGSYHSIGDAVADAAGHHHVLMSPAGGQRRVHAWDGAGWSSDAVPGGAVEILFDAADNLWAIGSGLAVHVRRAGTAQWTTVAPKRGGHCFPNAVLDGDGRTAYVFALDCGTTSASVTRLDLAALLGEAIVGAGGAAAGTAAPVGGDAAASLADDPDRETDRVADGEHSPVDAALAGTSFAQAPVDQPPSDTATPVEDDEGEPLVLPRLEWRRLALPVSSVGLTARRVFDVLPPGSYGERWTVFGHDLGSDEYYVPEMDAELVGGNRYWAIQDVKAEVVVEMARRVLVRVGTRADVLEDASGNDLVGPAAREFRAHP